VPTGTTQFFLYMRVAAQVIKGHTQSLTRVTFPNRMTALAAALLLGLATAANAQDDVTQAVTLTLIVCPASAADQPVLAFLGPQVRQNPQPFAQYIKDAAAAKLPNGTWQFAFRLPPGKYYLTASTPFAKKNGCFANQPFAVIAGHDRHLVAAMVAPFRIGGEGYDRSIAGALPFPGMIVTGQQPGYPTQVQPIAVDGTMYDAESLGAHRYLLRFYLPGSDEYTSVEADFTHTAPGSHLQRNLTLADVRSGLRTDDYGPFWGDGGPQLTSLRR
jgi:hypothetical protein